MVCNLRHRLPISRILPRRSDTAGPPSLHARDCLVPNSPDGLGHHAPHIVRLPRTKPEGVKVTPKGVGANAGAPLSADPSTPPPVALRHILARASASLNAGRVSAERGPICLWRM